MQVLLGFRLAALVVIVHYFGRTLLAARTFALQPEHRITPAGCWFFFHKHFNPPFFRWAIGTLVILMVELAIIPYRVSTLISPDAHLNLQLVDAALIGFGIVGDVEMSLVCVVLWSRVCQKPWLLTFVSLITDLPMQWVFFIVLKIVGINPNPEIILNQSRVHLFHLVYMIASGVFLIAVCAYIRLVMGERWFKSKEELK